MHEPSLLAELTRLVVGLVFAFSALGKLTALRTFSLNLVESFRFPPHLARAAGALLILFEATLSVVLLAAPALGQPAMTLALASLGLFTLALAWRRLQAGQVRCSCFGDSDRPVSAYDFIRNLALILTMAGYLAQGAEPAALAASTQAALAGTALVLAVFTIYFHDTMELLFHSGRGRA
ncbi:MauE/DoxX family redox-associated membrane protein [Gallaecimonas sp. GXIMD4217]|uniref:MauE/DoxX family redox-associated membrane protein n=1 Tax=Gallaecimonas sp. GXIMD4217 TaxID=3131927 RepID=UPI00311B24E3